MPEVSVTGQPATAPIVTSANQPTPRDLATIAADELSNEELALVPHRIPELSQSRADSLSDGLKIQYATALLARLGLEISASGLVPAGTAAAQATAAVATAAATVTAQPAANPDVLAQIGPNTPVPTEIAAATAQAAVVSGDNSIAGSIEGGKIQQILTKGPGATSPESVSASTSVAAGRVA